jgi:hypothetical protein
MCKTIESFTNVIGFAVTLLFGVSGLKDPEFQHGAQIIWGTLNPRHTITQWDNVSIWALELFGLPGDKYIVDINVNEMVWWFKDPADQTLFVLRNGSAKCIELNYQT